MSTQKVGWGVEIRVSVQEAGSVGKQNALYISPSLVSLSLAIGSQTEEKISATH